jgi:L-fucose isomerase-like protein
MQIRKPRIVFLPFGYPDYPEQEIERKAQESFSFLNNLDIEVINVDPITTSTDIDRARNVLKHEDYDAIIITLISWVEAPLLIDVIRDYKSIPLVLWSHTTYMDGKSRVTLGALPAAGVIRETLEEMYYKFIFICGMPGDRNIEEKMLPFLQAAKVSQQLSHSRIGLFGYASMGMYTGTIDHTQLRDQIGIEIAQQDQYMIINRYDHISENVVEKLMPMIEYWNINQNIKDSDLHKVFRMYAAIKELSVEGRYDAITIKCQYELSKIFGLAPCLPLSILGNEMVVSCEGDIPLSVSQLILHYMTGEVTSYGDFHYFTEHEIGLAACGFAPLIYANGKPVINKHTSLYDGLLNSSSYKNGDVTIMRLAAKNNGFKMHIAHGTVTETPDFHEVGCPPYAFMMLKLDGDSEFFIQNLYSQHYAIAYGDVTAELIELCKLLNIESKYQR